MTTGLGFADALGADDNGWINVVVAAWKPWVRGAYVLGSAAALLLMSQRMFIAVLRDMAMMVCEILQTSFEYRTQMNGTLLQECSAHRLKGIADACDICRTHQRGPAVKCFAQYPWWLDIRREWR